MRCLRQRGQRRLERQVLAAPRVDAAEQRIDEPVHELSAEPPANPAGHRLIGVAARVRQAEVLPRPRQAGVGQDASSGQLAEVRGHAHELPARQRPDAAAGPDSGRGRAWRLKFAGQAQLADQADAFGTAGEKRLGAGVDGYAADL